MDQISKELVTTADSSDTSWSIAPKRMLKCSVFDPRKANKRDGSDRREEREWQREFEERGGWQTGGWSGAQGSVGGAWSGGKGGGVGFGGKGTYWFDEAPQGPTMLAWSGSETTSTQATNQGCNQALGSWPLWAVHASAKIHASEAQEVPLQNRFEHLAEDGEGEQLIPMTPEESVPLMVESSRSGQCQNKRDRSVYVPRAMPRKSQKERKKASIHGDTPPGILCPLWHAQAEDLRKPLCPVNDYRSEQHGWTRIRPVPDSGAIESVAPNDMAPGYQVVAGPDSRRGQKYVSASGDEIANEGEQRLPMVSNNGIVTEQKWQLVAVTRQLQSVVDKCDAGKRVVFGRGGGIIPNLHTGEVTPHVDTTRSDISQSRVGFFSGWANAERVLRRTAFASTQCQPRETFRKC